MQTRVIPTAAPTAGNDEREAFCVPKSRNDIMDKLLTVAIVIALVVQAVHMIGHYEQTFGYPEDDFYHVIAALKSI